MADDFGPSGFTAPTEAGGALQYIQELQSNYALMAAQVQAQDQQIAKLLASLGALQDVAPQRVEVQGGGTSGLVAGSAKPNAVADTGHAGAMASYARADHKHEGVVFGGEVTALPAIPDTGLMRVIWNVSDDLEEWGVHAGATRWYALYQYSSRSGVPV